MSSTPDYGLRFWVGVGIGSILMGWGVFLFLEATPQVDRRLDLVFVVVGSDVIHDALIAPLVCLVGAVVARAAPPWLRAPVQSALIASAAVLAVVWLPLQRSADAVGNSSIQPLNYSTAALTVLAIVWMAALGWALVRWWPAPGTRRPGMQPTLGDPRAALEVNKDGRRLRRGRRRR